MAKIPQRTKRKPGIEQPSLFDERSEQSNSNNIFQLTQTFSKYFRDFIGVLLIAGSILLLLGYVGITKGVIVTPLVNWVNRWFGLGKYLLAFSFIYLGIILIIWHKNPDKKLNLGRILLIEVSILVLMGILSIASLSDIISSETGKNPGGIIGWGIAEFFSIFLGRIGAVILLSLIFLAFIFAAFGIFAKLKKWVRNQLGEEENFQLTPTQSSPVSYIAQPQEQPQPNRQPAIKPAETRTPLPREYHKSFEIPQPEKPNREKISSRATALPPLSILEEEKSSSPDKHTINMTAGLIEKTLADFGIPSKVVGFRVGPTVIQYAVEPGFIEKSTSDERQKIRISQISSLSKDLALALKAERLRIEAPVPGKSYVGIEIPNSRSTIVRLRPMLESESFFRINSPLAIPLGRDVSGQPLIADLATMPHLLVAGTTGSGKSVCIAAITTCLVMNNTPDTLKLVMIDPKLVELMRFNGLPHLLGQVETEIERILAVLRWATAEMDYRYKLLEKVKARDLASYNTKVTRTNQPTLPRIVILIDELADLMMTAPDQTEHALVRLAQKSRAVGIHLVVATQRPSTDVVTGVIKANFPTRIAFTVASSIDSRVILDTSGAETLLGKGDMLYLHPEIGTPIRSQGVMVTDKELDHVVKWWQTAIAENAIQEETKLPPWEETISFEGENGDDGLIDKAIEILRKDGRASASYLQRQLRIGYPRAARLIDQLEEKGVIGPSQGGGKEREILLTDDTDET
jgi:S-DNA-T family DNA segregation ATPase FtsK/SpoIIIE